ncbi:MAG: DUF4286 family protein [Saprospiraceae bacterium]|nr:DUF4286 family protein [Saprospiraceae bacterium]
MEIIYNVTIIIDHSVHDTWVQWMKEVHIPNVMASGKFSSWMMLRILEESNPDGVTYAIQYRAPNLESYLEYQHDCAPALQQEVQEKFGGKFGAFRTCMEVMVES